MLENILLFKEKLNVFIKKWEIIIKGIGKFCIVLATMITLNHIFQQEGIFNDWFMIVLVSLVSVFFSNQGVLVIQACIIAIELSGISFGLAVLAIVAYILLWIYHLRFYPEQILIVMLMPALYEFGIPAVILMVAGMICGISALIPVLFGVYGYFLLNNAGSTSISLIESAEGENEDVASIGQYLIDNFLFDQKKLIYILITFTLVFLTVYVISRLSMDYSNYAAIMASGAVNVFMLLIGEFQYGFKLKLVAVLGGTVVSCVIASIYRFFSCTIDYSRTEYVQFEDDDYLYYVKAVPKITVIMPEKNIKNINMKNINMKKMNMKNLHINTRNRGKK